MKTIKLCDYRNFVSRQCNDGGRYGFKTIFQKLPNGKYKVHYKTTSYLDYCDKCGEWHNPYTCQQDYDVITEDEVQRKIYEFENTFSNDPRCWIE